MYLGPSSRAKLLQTTTNNVHFVHLVASMLYLFLFSVVVADLMGHEIWGCLSHVQREGGTHACMRPQLGLHREHQKCEVGKE